jgi:electron transfer flavoprotein alpha subunit
MTTLIIAEHTHNALKPSLYSVVTGSMHLNQPCHLLILGCNAAGAVQEAATLQGIEKVIYVDHPAFKNPKAEVLTEAVLGLAKSYTSIVAPATSFGKNFLPRVAAQLDVMQISDVIEIHDSETFTRPIYAGNALITLKSDDPIKVMTLRPTAFVKCAKKEAAAPIENLSITLTQESLCQFVSKEESLSERPELTSARVVVSGGRGLQSGENFKLIEALADVLKGAIGASRAAVDAGYVPNDYQVGQTGKVVAPELYIAVGISGAIQHLAGMKESKVIVAINKDEEAPIFQIADYGLVGDLFDIVPQLTESLRSLKAS